MSVSLKKILIAISPLFLIGFFPTVVSAATLYLDPPAVSAGKGSIFVVEVRLDR